MIVDQGTVLPQLLGRLCKAFVKCLGFFSRFDKTERYKRKVSSKEIIIRENTDNRVCCCFTNWYFPLIVRESSDLLKTEAKHRDDLIYLAHY